MPSAFTAATCQNFRRTVRVGKKKKTLGPPWGGVELDRGPRGPPPPPELNVDPAKSGAWFRSRCSLPWVRATIALGPWRRFYQKDDEPLDGPSA